MSSDWVRSDRDHVWHPYSAMGSDLPVFPVVSADGVMLTLEDGRQLIDGMSSWWCAIHGYNHPVLNRAITQQLNQFSHVMFGGLTHPPAAKLAQKLVDITPEPLQSVFFSDSGSVAVEVAIKMALQYWFSQEKWDKKRIIALRGGYHGDTLGTMALCDPDNGMHTLFSEVISKHHFIPRPECQFSDTVSEEELRPLKDLLQREHQNCAAIIMEPIVQGAGGMHFYAPDYLKAVRALCDEYGVLLILDEIATGFGRTGRLFASEHAGVSADILCLGKALTGGYMTLAATLTTTKISAQISSGEPGVFMHGPTFMANPLACSVSLASIDLLLDSPWQQRVADIAIGLEKGLAACRDLPNVAEARVLGAIGVVELSEPVDMATIQSRFVEAGVWVRPFGKLVYLMPPYIINPNELERLTSALVQVLKSHKLSF